MKKELVMTAIAHEIEFWFKVVCNENNSDKGKRNAAQKINDLYEAYFELRGHKGTVVFVQGTDAEANSVQSIYDLSHEYMR